MSMRGEKPMENIWKDEALSKKKKINNGGSQSGFLLPAESVGNSWRLLIGATGDIRCVSPFHGSEMLT